MAQAKIEWNDESEKRFNEAFDSLDIDRSGKLTFDQVKEKIMLSAVRRMGHNPTDSEINMYLDAIDKDGDGAISKEELRDWIKEFVSKLGDPEKILDFAMQIMFKACDLDGNGRISVEEFSKFMKDKGRPIPDIEIRKIFKALDVDGDIQTLNKEEFLSLLLKGREHKLKQKQQQQQQQS